MSKLSSSRLRPLPAQIFCNGLTTSTSRKRKRRKIALEYRPEFEAVRNIRLLLPDFIRSVFHLPDRVQDLLEIAAYVFCADRHITRGRRDALEFHSWSREMEYFIRVRDAEFWNTKEVLNALREALVWVTGDRNHSFVFTPGHITDPADMLDSKEHALDGAGHPRVVLFSGGLDSLCGVIDLLSTTPDSIWPISHISAPSTVRTQRSLIKALKNTYRGRINHRTLECQLHGIRAPEESQRTRAFLYCSMAFAMAVALNQSSFYVYENGVTALNFRKRGSTLNARASRTAHPKTLRLLQNLYSLIGEKHFNILAPFSYKTKSEVLELLVQHDGLNLLNSAVSCSRTYITLGQATHCGECSQCIDRRFAAYATGCDSEDDASGYAFDFITESVPSGETRTAIIDYIRQARHFLHANVDNFQANLVAELADAVNEKESEVPQVESIHSLCKRHGSYVQRAAARMVEPLGDYPHGSLRTILYQTDFALPPVFPLAQQIATEIEEFVRRAYAKERPNDEPDLNLKIDGYLSGHKEKSSSGAPLSKFCHSADNSRPLKRKMRSTN